MIFDLESLNDKIKNAIKLKEMIEKKMNRLRLTIQKIQMNMQML